MLFLAFGIIVPFVFRTLVALCVLLGFIRSFDPVLIVVGPSATLGPVTLVSFVLPDLLECVMLSVVLTCAEPFDSVWLFTVLDFNSMSTFFECAVVFDLAVAVAMFLKLGFVLLIAVLG